MRVHAREERVYMESAPGVQERERGGGGGETHCKTCVHLSLKAQSQKPNGVSLEHKIEFGSWKDKWRQLVLG